MEQTKRVMVRYMFGGRGNLVAAGPFIDVPLDTPTIIWNKQECVEKDWYKHMQQV